MKDSPGRIVGVVTDTKLDRAEYQLVRVAWSDSSPDFIALSSPDADKLDVFSDMTPDQALLGRYAEFGSGWLEGKFLQPYDKDDPMPDWLGRYDKMLERMCPGVSKILDEFLGPRKIDQAA